MRKLILGALAFGLLAGCAGVAAVTAKADTAGSLCGDYARALESATPWKAKIPAAATGVIDKANAVGGLVCAFTSSQALFSAAVAGWTTAAGSS